MFLSYFESAEGEVISRDRALRELRKHGLDDPETVRSFFSDLGERDEYDAQQVLIWLGY